MTDFIVTGPNATPIAGGFGEDTLFYTLGSGTGGMVVDGLTFTPSGYDGTIDVPGSLDTDFTGIDNFVITDDVGGNDLITTGDGQDDLTGGDGKDTLTGGGGNDRIQGNSGKDKLYGGLDADHLLGGKGVDKLYGGDGDDALDGGAGNDRLFGDDGNDQLLGGSGDDKLNGGAGSDDLGGGEGNDTILGKGGGDFVDAGDGDDHIEGNGGSDFIITGSGNDTVLGGKGDDFVETDLAGAKDIDAGGGYDWITVFADGPFAPGDVLRFDMNTGVHGVDGDTANQSMIVGAEAYDLLGDIDAVLTGDAGDNELGGGGGNDTIKGGDGGDTLFGSEGDDELRGKSGRDAIYGDGGDDTMFGGKGADEFHFTQGVVSAGHDTISDFESGVDEIIISGALVAPGVTVEDLLRDNATIVDGNTVLTLDPDASLTILGVDDQWLLAGDLSIF